jgi:hypothetical protein
MYVAELNFDANKAKRGVVERVMKTQQRQVSEQPVIVSVSSIQSLGNQSLSFPRFSLISSLFLALRPSGRSDHLAGDTRVGTLERRKDRGRDLGSA